MKENMDKRQGKTASAGRMTPSCNHLSRGFHGYRVLYYVKIMVNEKELICSRLTR